MTAKIDRNQSLNEFKEELKNLKKDFDWKFRVTTILFSLLWICTVVYFSSSTRGVISESRVIELISRSGVSGSGSPQGDLEAIKQVNSRVDELGWKLNDKVLGVETRVDYLELVDNTTLVETKTKVLGVEKRVGDLEILENKTTLETRENITRIAEQVGKLTQYKDDLEIVTDKFNNYTIKLVENISRVEDSLRGRFQNITDTFKRIFDNFDIIEVWMSKIKK